MHRPAACLSVCVFIPALVSDLAPAHSHSISSPINRPTCQENRWSPLTEVLLLRSGGKQCGPVCGPQWSIHPRFQPPVTTLSAAASGAAKGRSDAVIVRGGLIYEDVVDVGLWHIHIDTSIPVWTMGSMGFEVLNNLSFSTSVFCKSDAVSIADRVVRRPTWTGPTVQWSSLCRCHIGLTVVTKRLNQLNQVCSKTPHRVSPKKWIGSQITFGLNAAYFCRVF